MKSMLSLIPFCGKKAVETVFAGCELDEQYRAATVNDVGRLCRARDFKGYAWRYGRIKWYGDCNGNCKPMFAVEYSGGNLPRYFAEVQVEAACPDT